MAWTLGQPKHPQYSVDRVRLSSYSRWPMSSSQSPMMLSDAGFFYCGYADCVRCFHCGGGLRHWKDWDSPLIEHARWYPDCNFLRHLKGDSFVRKHSQENVQNESETQKRWPEEKSGPNDVKESVQDEKQLIAMKSVAEMGYPMSTVEACVATLRKQGKTNFKAADIMEVIFEQEDQIEAVHVYQASHPKTSDISADVQSFSQSNPVCGAAGAPSNTSYTEFQVLFNETKQLKDQMLCKICLDNNACVVYLPCGHMVTCQQCANTIRKCCICRQLVEGTIKAYM